MSESAASPATPADTRSRCDACGEPLAELVDGCCPLCNHRLLEPDVTSVDHTPYAEASAARRPGWRPMCRWVCGAGRERLMHLALIRPSADARRFARINILSFSAAVTLATFVNTGWHLVTRQPGSLNMPPTPQGRGWWEVLQRPVSAKNRFAEVLDTAVWWNVPQAILTAAVTFLLVAVAGLLLLRVIAYGGQRAAQGPSQHEPRLRTAICYSTAWLPLLSLGAALVALRPVAYIGRVADWSALRSTSIFDMVAVLTALVALLLWWFWLIRLGQATPRETRPRVGRFFLLWTPLWGAAFVAGVGYAIRAGSQQIALKLNLVW